MAHKPYVSAKTTLQMLVWAVLALAVAACANIGRPQGGATDIEPPIYVHSSPAPGEKNVSKSRMSITFNENVQLEDAFSKVVVSPPQKTPPQVSANGKNVSVAFKDTLIPNTTYTIDFADAIKDLNEGNILDGFALDFSTGDTIDTLRISGMVLQASNLEPAQGMLVGVYTNLSDTALTTLPMERIARTNQFGQFTIRNLPQGAYRIFAINDVNRDYHWDRSEDIAFCDSLICPTTEVIAITDTLYSSTGTDSLVDRSGIRYLPNDVLLTWFNIGYKAPYLADYKRTERRKITLTFGAPQDTLPTLTIVDGAPGVGQADSIWALRYANTTGDSLIYWLRDTTVVNADSLRLAVNYKKLDSLERPIWTTDTLRFFFRDMEKKKKKKDKDEEEEAPKFLIDSITGDTIMLPPPNMEYLDIKAITNSQHDVNKDVVIEFSQPLEHFDSTAWRLCSYVDSVWTPINNITLRPDSLDPLLRRNISYPWVPENKYRVEIDTLAATGIYGHWNKPFKHEFTIKALAEYSNLHVVLPGLDSTNVVVELLNSSDAPQYNVSKELGKKYIDFKLVPPGTYYMRLFIDSNNNGKWDTGNPVDSIQPEEVYYFAKKLELRKNWDVEQTWDIYELPIDKQKPYAIKKNKPKLKRGEQAPVEEEEDEDDLFADPFSPSNKNSNNPRNNRNNRNTTNSMNGLRRNNLR